MNLGPSNKVGPERELTRDEDDRLELLLYDEKLSEEVRWAIGRLLPLAARAGSSNIRTHPDAFNARLLSHDMVNRSIAGTARWVVATWCDKDGKTGSSWTVESLSQANILVDLLKEEIREHIGWL